MFVNDDESERLKQDEETTENDAAIAKALDSLEKAEEQLNKANELINVILVDDQQNLKEKLEHDHAVARKISSLSIVHPDLEVLDPNPDIYKLFQQFDKSFFNGFLCTKNTLLEWGNSLNTNAGRFYVANDVPTISLSADLLSLRSRRDLVETLLHEMIHAYIFHLRIVDDGDHGPVFQMHMKRINKAAGTKITITHQFHDEMLYVLKRKGARTLFI